MRSGRRTGILGGTFDPIHQGHLDVAVTATRVLGLTELLLMPAWQSPTRVPPRASAFHRFTMAGLASLDYAQVRVSDLEMRLGGTSYTSETLARLVSTGCDPLQLFFIAGADAFAEIATWKDYPALLDRCHFAVVSRPGHAAPELRQRLPDLAARMLRVTAEAGTSWMEPGRPAILIIDAVTTDVSSTDVRRRVASGEPLAGLVPHDVERYIHRHDLYRIDTPAATLHD